MGFALVPALLSVALMPRPLGWARAVPNLAALPRARTMCCDLGVSVNVQVSLDDGAAAEWVTLSSADDPAAVAAELAERHAVHLQGVSAILPATGPRVLPASGVPAEGAPADTDRNQLAGVGIHSIATQMFGLGRCGCGGKGGGEGGGGEGAEEGAGVKGAAAMHRISLCGALPGVLPDLLPWHQLL